MADVFISYSRRDKALAQAIAESLEQTHSVWWDRDLLSGQAYVREIRKELAAAKAILVIWSPAAQKSKWVLAEALHGFDTDRLVQIAFGVAPEVPFSALHCDMASGGLTPEVMVALARAIDARVSPEAAEAASVDDDALFAEPADPMLTVKTGGPSQRRVAVAAMNAGRINNVLMGFSGASSTLATLLLGSSAGLAAAHAQAAQSDAFAQLIPSVWESALLPAAATLGTIGAVIILRNTFSHFLQRA